jgi:hypothetical protein
MAVVTVDFTPSKYRRAWIAIVSLGFLGLMLLAAVREMKVECQAVGLTGRGGAPLIGRDGALLTGGEQCELVIGDVRVPVASVGAGDHQVT